MGTSAFLRNIQASVSRYQAESESWQQDHDQALQCLEFEQLVAYGISVYQLLGKLNEIWKLRVAEHFVDYDAAMDDAIELLYRSWLEPCPRILRQITAFESAGFDVVGAREFRAACQEAETTTKLIEGLRIGKMQLDRGEMIAFSEALQRARKARAKS